MSKRKILVVAAALCMVAVLAVGGTLAFFTDTDSATNVFTAGKVDITLNEYQRDGETLKNFDTTTSKKLLPIVGSAQGEKDSAFNMPVAKNYVDKIITVTVNESSENCYVRLYVAIPEILDNVTDAGKNILHFNIGTGAKNIGDTSDDWGAETCVAKSFEIDGVKYNVYYRNFENVLTAETETFPAYMGFYLDKDVDYQNGEWVVIRNGVTAKLGNSLANVKIPVVAVGVQADGFDSADAAIEAAFGAGYNPWVN